MVDLQRLVIELEAALPREVAFHCPRLRAELMQFLVPLVYSNAVQVEEEPSLDRWAKMFIEQHLKGWNCQVDQVRYWSKSLISESSLPLLVCRFGQPGIEEFTERFSDAWNRIAQADAKKTILEYWQQGTPPKVFEHYGKLLAGIELTADYLPQEPPAKTCLWGFHVCFDATRIFKHDDPEFLTFVVMHELAHVWCYATNDPAHLQVAPRNSQALLDWHQVLENQVKAVLSDWGLDMGKHDRFVCDEQGR
jgi:hypothetical protein